MMYSPETPATERSHQDWEDFAEAVSSHCSKTNYFLGSTCSWRLFFFDAWHRVRESTQPSLKWALLPTMIKKKFLYVPCQWNLHLPQTHVDANVQVVFVMFCLTQDSQSTAPFCTQTPQGKEACAVSMEDRVREEYDLSKRMPGALHTYIEQRVICNPEFNDM